MNSTIITIQESEKQQPNMNDQKQPNMEETNEEDLIFEMALQEIEQQEQIKQTNINAPNDKETNLNDDKNKKTNQTKMNAGTETTNGTLPNQTNMNEEKKEKETNMIIKSFPRIHTCWRQTNTGTGRLASMNPVSVYLLFIYLLSIDLFIYLELTKFTQTTN
jgi:hypothetical protein